MRFAGRPSNRDADLRVEAAAINAEFVVSLDRVEVGHTVRSVERYRAKWIAEGRYYSDAERAAWGRNRQALGVRVRRRKNVERDAAIVRDWLAGAKQVELAARYSVNQSTVSRILCRELPLLATN